MSMCVYISKDSSNTHFILVLNFQHSKLCQNSSDFCLELHFVYGLATKYIVHLNLSIHFNGTIYKKK